MARYLSIRNVAFGIAVLMALSPFLAERNPASGQDLSPQAKAALKERDRLWDQAQELRAAGKTVEAIAAGAAMLAIERKLLPADDPDLAVSLDFLAGMYLPREDLAKARAARHESLGILRKRYGETHWKVTDARLALEDVERLGRMTRAQRQKLGRGGSPQPGDRRPSSSR
jgi:hypothetical protein